MQEYASGSEARGNCRAEGGHTAKSQMAVSRDRPVLPRQLRRLMPDSCKGSRYPRPLKRNYESYTGETYSLTRLREPPPFEINGLDDLEGAGHILCLGAVSSVGPLCRRAVLAALVPDGKALDDDHAAAFAAPAEPKLIAPRQALRQEDRVLE